MERYAEFAKVQKYQRISHIYKEIIREYADKAGYTVHADRSGNTEMIVFYSPAGGAGKTTAALRPPASWLPRAARCCLSAWSS